MNTLKALLFILILFSIGCENEQKKQIKTRRKITFVRYLNSLDHIPLPFEHACSGPNFPALSTHFDSAGFKKYRDENCARPLGILFDDKENLVLVDISLADFCSDPFLVSFDRKGNKLDVLNVYGNTFADTASSSMPYFKITKDKQIVITDTLKSWKTGPDFAPMPGSVVTTIYTTTYRLSRSGKFIKEARKKL